MVDAAAVTYLAPLIVHPDAKLKRQVASALAQIAKHSVDLAEVVVEAEIFPNFLNCLKVRQAQQTYAFALSLFCIALC